MVSTYLAPDIYVEEISSGARPIEGVGTSTAGFVGTAPRADVYLNEPVAINNWSQFVNLYVAEGSASTPLSNAVYGFFQNGGTRCYVVNIAPGQPLSGGGRGRNGLDALEQIDEVAIVAAPGYTDPASYDALITHCEKMRDRVGILDSVETVADITKLTEVATVPASAAGGDGKSKGGKGASGDSPATAADAGGLRPRQSDTGAAAFYFPWLVVRDPLAPKNTITVPPSGHIAGIWARTDATRGVHKAPANEVVRGALNLTYRLTREEQGLLNQQGVNCIRLFAREGIRVWGGRTLAPSASEWRYLNVRRLFNMIEESIADNTRWIVFEPNDVTLWKSIRRDISAFLVRLWRDGALVGATQQEAFFVKCDAETNPPEVVDAGQVVTLIGIAPVKPAEFIVFRVSQYASGVDTQTI